METVTLPKATLENLQMENKRLHKEVKILRNTKLYRRLLDVLENLKTKEYSRTDVDL